MNHNLIVNSFENTSDLDKQLCNKIVNLLKKALKKVV